MKIVISVLLVVTFSATAACGQAADEVEVAVVAMVAEFKTATTSLGWSMYRSASPGESAPDSVEVYFNRDGESTAWRAWMNGRYYVHYKPLGTVQVTDSIAIAYETLKDHRDAVELLELLDQVERAAKTRGVAVQE